MAQVRARRVSQLCVRACPIRLPDLPVQRLPQPAGRVTRYLYGQIVNYPAPTYRHPAEAEAKNLQRELKVQGVASEVVRR